MADMGFSERYSCKDLMGRSLSFENLILPLEYPLKRDQLVAMHHRSLQPRPDPFVDKGTLIF